MAPGAIAGCQSLFSVRLNSLVEIMFTQIRPDSFYKNIVLYMTQFWVRLTQPQT